MGTSSYSSSLRNGGRPLRMAYPIDGKNTFRPSGNPTTDPPERPSISELEWMRSVLGIDTREGVRAFDRLLGGEPSEDTAYCDRLRFLQQKSPRARKRAEGGNGAGCDYEVASMLRTATAENGRPASLR
jgi:hypothetical protein